MPDSVPEIDAIETAMSSIVATTRDRESPVGFFAAMYLGVTAEVRRGVIGGVFSHPERLTMLTATFARRYIDAWSSYEATERLSESWRVAFDAGTRWRPTVLQHLLLGMNAHINLDLAIAAAEVAPGATLQDLRSDFDQINDVLAGLVSTIQGQLNQVSPLYRFIDDVAGDADRAVINFSIGRARAEAWKLANHLAVASPQEAAFRIDGHDGLVALIGKGIVHPGLKSSTGLLAIRLTERRYRSSIIDLFAEDQGTTLP